MSARFTVDQLPPHLRNQLYPQSAEPPGGDIPETPKNKYKVASKDQRTCDGIVFDSKWEMTGYQILAPVLKDRVVLQPKYLLQEGFRHLNRKIQPIYYFGDFDILSKDLSSVDYTLDFKGMVTPEFRLKRKLFLKKYMRDIVQVKTKKQLKRFMDVLLTES